VSEASSNAASRQGKTQPRSSRWVGRELDNDRLEAWPDFFVDDCLYKITSAENYRRGYAAGIVYADSRAMLRDRVTALRTANIYERQSYRHIIGLPLTNSTEPDGIAAETPFLVARIMRDGRTDLFATGVYIDKLREEAFQLRFVERIVVCDSGHFDTLLAIPL
jgi:3-phenylpropionate/cinnamic acid dioxygenase small subunit